MTDPNADFEVFLQSWQPSEILDHACLPANVHDPLAAMRLTADFTADGELKRTEFAAGKKQMTDVEASLRKFDYIRKNRRTWAKHFRDYALNAGLSPKKYAAYRRAFATQWIDGMRRRQDSPEMMAIKASIRDHDESFHPKEAGKHVLTPIPSDVTALLEPWEMQIIFRANKEMLEVLLPDYIEALEGDRGGSINRLYVRRGVFMPGPPGDLREERFYLSSYSLALTPAEQFAQTWTAATQHKGVACVFSAPMPAVQDRVVAFAPFIHQMDLSQLELVVAPPIAPTALVDMGVRGGIRDYEFT